MLERDCIFLNAGGGVFKVVACVSLAGVHGNDGTATSQSNIYRAAVKEKMEGAGCSHTERQMGGTGCSLQLLSHTHTQLVFCDMTTLRFTSGAMRNPHSEFLSFETSWAGDIQPISE
jgi:hypothetical protein